MTLADTVVPKTVKAWRVAPTGAYAKVELQHDFDPDADTFIPQVRVAGSNPADNDKIGGAVTAKSVSGVQRFPSAQ